MKPTWTGFGTSFGVVLALGAACLVGCAAKSEQRLGGETNWLSACVDDGDCESSSCVCGACTSECSVDADCSGLAGARCVTRDDPAASAQCGAKTVALCLPECDRDADCASGQDCEGGSCVVGKGGSEPGPTSSMPDPNMTPDASPGGTMPEPSGSGPGPNQSVPNPSGDCVAEDDGGRIEHAPDATDVYLPDCQLALTHEYYRVFQQQDGTAYMIPRPDNHPAFFLPCLQDMDDTFRQTLERYDLCQTEPFDGQQVARVNAMGPADALEIAHYLHEQLVFVPGDSSTSPYADASDILELCQTDDDFKNGAMMERCEFELDQAANGGPRAEIGWTMTAEQALVTATALNALYGIEGEDLCQRLGNDAGLTMSLVIEAQRGPCETDADCIQYGHASQCHDSCGRVVTLDGQGEVDAVRDQIDARQCVLFEEAQCTLVPPPCVPPTEARCIGGMCEGG